MVEVRPTVLALVSAGASLAVLILLVPIFDTGAGIEFQTTGANLYGSLLIVVAFLASLCGHAALRHTLDRFMRAMAHVGRVLGAVSALGAAWMFFVFTPG